MMATVRNRRGLVVSVDPFDAAPEGRLHLVRVEYTDPDGVAEDTLLWEREPHRALLEPTALPRVADQPPMPGEDFDALVRATRWSALTPFLRPDAPDQPSDLPIASPFFGAVQVEDFQLVPLLKALQMPRVSLLLADDVGLGKTVEAGLVLTELLLRRRIRRVLVLTPASLRKQWQQEMRDKFSLGFDVIDRTETHALQARLGLDANPWRTFPRIIASYYYLRQPDVLEQFLAVCRAQTPGAYQLPWDLLVVDEAHNLMPSNFGNDSDLSEMLRLISPYFEHKLFLTATPHNGHTRCFSGLLEQLDPVRFTQKSELSEEEKNRIEDVLVRRLKRDINALDDSLERPRRFAERYPEPLPLFFGSRERALATAFAAFRARIKEVTAKGAKGDRTAGMFAVEVLNKRLLSCPVTFADSWIRFRRGLAEAEAAEAAEVSAARRAAEEELDDDREREERAAHAARVVGAWLKPLAGWLDAEITAIDQALARLGVNPVESAKDAEALVLSEPSEDARFDRVLSLLEQKLRKGKKWGDDERLIVFTEYKTTLDYVERRLRKALGEASSKGAGAGAPPPDALRVLYGGMDLGERDAIKQAFNDPDDPVRVLIATDAAAEGLNLQETARLLLHYDIPWNPARLEQRNGRLDRHGQARDVSVYHFTSENDADLQFLGKVVAKVHAIREDLGSMGEVFDAAFQRRFADLEDAERVAVGLDADVARQKDRAPLPRQAVDTATAQESERLQRLCRHIDLAPETLRSTLEVALGLGVGRPRLSGPDARGRMQLKQPIPPRWEALVDDSLRLPTSEGGRGRGALPGLIFDAKQFVTDHGGRPVFRPTRDTVLLHLGHPMFREALTTFARLRFPGEKEVIVSRWTARRGAVPAGADALLLVTVEELGVNELREPFHHWVRTIRIPVKDGELGAPVDYVAPADEQVAPGAIDDEARRAALACWDDVSLDLGPVLRKLAAELGAQLREHLAAAGKRAMVEEKKRYQHRLKEVETAMRETTLAKLEKERDKLIERQKQGTLFPEIARETEARLADLNDELHRRRTHYQELLRVLEADQERVLSRMLPRRYALHGAAQVFPVAVEIRLPAARSGGAR
ncbi:DNA helicase [Sorangium cellulosum]|uniref:DNA helicase n=1 Tax=Sorangium cellulosum TaxID=56 RepID=A0A150RE12_SORCE|nr:DNA helicase [Sorangium cellulosum]KYF87958.1 DNA helicase [Sorangium cellulosum]